MPNVTLTINGKNYGVACDAGQENRVRELGHYIDQRVRTLATHSGPASEAHLIVLAALVLADEVFDVRETLAQAQRTVHQLQRQSKQAMADVASVPGNDELNAVTETLLGLAERVDQLTARVKKAA